MKNTIQESQSGLKLLAILFVIFAFGLANVMSDGDEDISMLMLNPSKVLIFKVLQGLLAILLFVVPSVLFSVYWTNAKINYLQIKNMPSLLSLVLGALGILFAQPLINWMAEINQSMHMPDSLSGIELWMQQSEDKAEVLIKAFTAGTTIDVLLLNLIVIALIAAIGEEFFFRGVLQKVLFEFVKNKHVAIFVAAFLFSAFHLQFYGFLPRLLMGMYLGYLFLWSGSLWVPIVAHFFNNAMAVLLMWLTNRGTINIDIDKMGVEKGDWLSLLISCVLVFSILYTLYKNEKKTQSAE